MKPVVTIAGKGLKELRARMEDYAGPLILVGVPDGLKTPDGQSLALVALSNEFGTADGHIPERSFLRAGLHRASADISKLTALNIKRVEEKKLTVDQALNQIGLFAASAVQNEFAIGDFVPNAESTIKAKGSSQPLKNTGQLMQSVTYMIDKGAV